MPSAARSRERSSPVTAMAAAVSPRCLSWQSASRRRPSDAEAIQLENVVRRAHERPFPLHLLESAQQELPKAARLFDLADHRFDDRFPRGVDLRAGLDV